MIKGIILDVDGTLVLSNEANTQAWMEALNRFEQSTTAAQVRSLMGRGSDQLLPQIDPSLSPDTTPGEQITEVRGQLMKQHLGHLQAAPGAVALVNKLEQLGLKLIVATSAQPEELSALLQQAGLEHLVSNAVTAADVHRSKPALDLIAVALRRLHLRPDEVVMIGDAPYDIISAHRNGVSAIAVRCGGFSEEELIGADATYAHPADLLAHLDESIIGSFERPKTWQRGLVIAAAVAGVVVAATAVTLIINQQQKRRR